MDANHCIRNYEMIDGNNASLVSFGEIKLEITLLQMPNCQTKQPSSWYNLVFIIQNELNTYTNCGENPERENL